MMKPTNNCKREPQFERFLDLPNLQATEQLAKDISLVTGPGDIIKLKGPIGAGKTSFVRSLIGALGVLEEVPSPTYTLVQTYRLADLTIWHFDLYRIEHPEEVYELGLEEAALNGLSLIEWPERIACFLPENHAELTFRIKGLSQRTATLKGFGSWGPRLRETSRFAHG